MPVKKRILIVDDDDSMLALYQRIFADSGYELTLADTVASARERMDGDRFDLLVTDFMFPDGLGTDLIDIFEEKYKGARTMLVSGSTTAPEAGKYPSLAAFFEKPFQIKLFLDTVAKALG